MSDNNIYVNAYIDSSIGMIHENVLQVLQLKAQLKVANDLLAAKDASLATLSEQLNEQANQFQNSNLSSSSEIHGLRETNRQLEEQYNGALSKLSHMDTLLKQISDMKSEIIERNEIIKNLEKENTKLKREIENLNVDEVVINTKGKKKQSTPKVVSPTQTVEQTDDF